MDPRNFGSSYLLYLDVASCSNLSDLASPATSQQSIGVGEAVFCEINYDQQERVNKGALAK